MSSQSTGSKRVVADSETLVGDVHDLRAFALVADLRSFTAAAQRMGESKATISRRIARLESALGIELLRRTPRLVDPTEDGVAYRARVGEILELLGDANAAVRGAHAEPTGVLRVTMPPGFEDLFAPLFVRFLREHPRVVPSAQVTERFVDLETEHVDVAIRATGKLPDSSLVAHRLVQSESIVVAAPSYVAAHGAPRVPAELADHTVVRVGPVGARPLILEREHEPSVELRVAGAMAASDIRCAKAVAIAGGGITILPRAAVRAELDAGALVPVLRRWSARGPTLYLLYRGGKFLPPKIRAFRDLVVSALAKDRRSRSDA